MKGFAGGRLFDEQRSPFGVCLTPVQCIHYALTRPADWLALPQPAPGEVYMLALIPAEGSALLAFTEGSHLASSETVSPSVPRVAISLAS